MLRPLAIPRYDCQHANHKECGPSLPDGKVVTWCSSVDPGGNECAMRYDRLKRKAASDHVDMVRTHAPRPDQQVETESQNGWNGLGQQEVSPPAQQQQPQPSSHQGNGRRHRRHKDPYEKSKIKFENKPRLDAIIESSASQEDLASENILPGGFSYSPNTTGDSLLNRYMYNFSVNSAYDDAFDHGAQGVPEDEIFVPANSEAGTPPLDFEYPAVLEVPPTEESSVSKWKQRRTFSANGNSYNSNGYNYNPSEAGYYPNGDVYNVNASGVNSQESVHIPRNVDSRRVPTGGGPVILGPLNVQDEGEHISTVTIGINGMKGYYNKAVLDDEGQTPVYQNIYTQPNTLGRGYLIPELKAHERLERRLEHEQNCYVNGKDPGTNNNLHSGQVFTVTRNANDIGLDICDQPSTTTTMTSEEQKEEITFLDVVTCKRRPKRPVCIIIILLILFVVIALGVVIYFVA